MAVSPRNALLAEQASRSRGERVLHHHPARVSGNVGVVAVSKSAEDLALVSRVLAAYRRSTRSSVRAAQSGWAFKPARKKQNEIALLERGELDSVAGMLREPAASMLFYGFESIQSVDVARNVDPQWLAWQHLTTYDNLLQLTRATGTRRVENPEADLEVIDTPGVEDVLGQLDDVFGFRIQFPNIFAGEVGLQTSRGIANYRAIQALYQAWRIKHLLADEPDARVLEIGGGLGRTGYFAMKMGIKSYTIIDIPLTGVAQGYFLGRVLGEETVSLWGEAATAPVRILPPAAYNREDERFDLIVNVDSFTEMAEHVARDYFEGAGKKCRRLLSINHEDNAFTVQEFCRGRRDLRVWRYPCWARRGYVEEVIEFAADRCSHTPQD